MVSFGGSGTGSELELRQMQSKNANLFHIRDGKVTRLVLYWDRNRALADLGLTREGEPSERRSVRPDPEAFVASIPASVGLRRRG